MCLRYSQERKAWEAREQKWSACRCVRKVRTPSAGRAIATSSDKVMCWTSSSLMMMQLVKVTTTKVGLEKLPGVNLTSVLFDLPWYLIFLSSFVFLWTCSFSGCWNLLLFSLSLSLSCWYIYVPWLQVSVPGNSMLNIVTVRCGHCANLLSVNLRALMHSLPEQQDQLQVCSIYAQILLGQLLDNHTHTENIIAQIDFVSWTFY